MTEAEKQFNEIMGSIPAPLQFNIAMVADSTNEVYADIDTGLDDGQALLIYGMEYVFESIDPTIPLVPCDTQSDTYTLQVHRNDDSLLLLNFTDDDVLMHHQVTMTASTQASYQFIGETVFKCAKRTVTMSPTLRAIFRTTSDVVALSAATNQISGYIYYDKIPAPSAGVTKIGQLANL